METIHTIPHAFGIAAAGGSQGWAAACRIVPDADMDQLARFERFAFELKPDRSAATWTEAFLGARRQALLAASDGAEIRTTVLGEARRMEGPAIAWGRSPAAVWSECDGRRWRLMLWDGARTRRVVESRSVLRRPAIAACGDDILIACERDRRGQAHVSVWTPDGVCLVEEPGRAPALAGSAAKSAWLLHEIPGPNTIRLAFRAFHGGVPAERTVLPPSDAFNMNPHLAWSPETGALYATWESCAAWGYHEMIGQHRDISLWRLDAGADAFQPAEGTSNGFIRLPPRAYNDRTPFNFCPVHPRVLPLARGPAVAFQTFRFMGMKAFGWDVHLVAWQGGRWEAPRRLSPNPGPPDAGYAVLADADGLLGVFPCAESRPIASFEEMTCRERWGQPTPLRAVRAEIVRFAVDEGLPLVRVPPRLRADYVIPRGVKDIALAPPPLPDPPAGMRLIWGDLHAHTAYSKCMSGNDGFPEDVLRYQRDVLGCRVLCLTDHIEYMGGPEFTHVLDRVAAEAGEACIPLYGVEWAMKPAHHTNFYAIDREIFDRLRVILLLEDHLTKVYERVRAELPEGAVVAIRHYHGVNADEYGTHGDKVTETHDPRFEWAMEAMQTRDNMMLPGKGHSRLFPNDFLNSGARIGLVGGSDHSRGAGPSSFCLTGFWVSEATPEAVFAALRGRRTLATSNGKLAIQAALDGLPIGSEVAVERPLVFKVQLACARPIRRVCLMRDGELLPGREIGETTASLELVDADPPKGAHWYSVTAEAETLGLKADLMAHASPFFVQVKR